MADHLAQLREMRAIVAVIAAGGNPKMPKHLDPAARRDALDAAIAALEAQAAATPATHQFQGRDGMWHGFINADHYRNTVADGTWPIRALYTSPVDNAKPVAWQYRELHFGEQVGEWLDCREDTYNYWRRPENAARGTAVVRALCVIPGSEADA